eukprot:s397_g45.t3
MQNLETQLESGLSGPLEQDSGEGTNYNYVVLANEVFLAKRVASDEVLDKDIKPEDREAWKIADGEEWAKIMASGCMRLLSLEGSHKISQSLAAEGKQDRILQTRMVRRLKPGEQIGDTPSRKSRLCIRGDKDPDLFELDKYAPTVSTQNLQVILQLAASKKFAGSCGDLKAAFTQSGPLLRRNGRLFANSPPGGVPGVQPGQIFEIIGGMCGLPNAPLRWRNTLKEYLIKDLEYRQSRLDPTVFCLYGGSNSELKGIIVVEIDDLLNFGDADHRAKLDRLRERQDKDYTVHVDMGKFVNERLHEVALGRGAGASILASRMSKLKVKDITDLNKVIAQVKAKAGLTLSYFPIPLEDLSLGIATDASWKNYDDGSSQGAFGVLAFDRKMLNNERARCSLLWWNSGKLKRKVPSTLAAETQALNRGLGELMWARAILASLQDPSFDLEEFKQSVKETSDLVLQRGDGSGVLRDSLAVVDAKSVYDNVTKEGAQAEDKYTALEVAIARERADGLGVQFRWVEHQSMIVDSLTKLHGGTDTLYELLDLGYYKLVAEEERLVEREQRRLEDGRLEQLSLRSLLISRSSACIRLCSTWTKRCRSTRAEWGSYGCQCRPTVNASSYVRSRAGAILLSLPECLLGLLQLLDAQGLAQLRRCAHVGCHGSALAHAARDSIVLEEPAELPPFFERPVAQTSHWLPTPDSPATQSMESLLGTSPQPGGDEVRRHFLGERFARAAMCKHRAAGFAGETGGGSKRDGQDHQRTPSRLDVGLGDRNIHETALKELGVEMPTSISELLNELEKVLSGVALLKEISMQTRDRIVSFGERLSVRTFAEAFNSSRKDPQDGCQDKVSVDVSLNTTKAPTSDAAVTRFSSELPAFVIFLEEPEARALDAWQAGMKTTSGSGSADSAFSSVEILQESYPAIKHHLGPLKLAYSFVPIVTGYIAKDARGVITTLGRDGSDLTATVIGAAVKASEVQIWKDVSGVQTTDPRVIAAAKPVQVLTFEEAAELSTFGSKVVHPAAVLPAWSAGVPMSIKNSMAPELPGTRIVPHLGVKDIREGRVAAISRMLGQHGFLAHVFQVFNKFAASVDVIATSEVTVSLTLDEGYKSVDLNAIEVELKEVAKVSVLHDMSMLTLITHKKDSVTVLKESCAAFEETSAAVYQFTRVFSQLGGCALYSGLRSLESAWLGCVERFTGKAFLAKPVQSKLEMVSHGASNVNVTFVLPGDQLLMASQRLHKVFFEKDG